MFYILGNLCNVWLNGSGWIPPLLLHSVGAVSQVSELLEVPLGLPERAGAKSARKVLAPDESCFGLTGPLKGLFRRTLKES